MNSSIPLSLGPKKVPFNIGVTCRVPKGPGPRTTVGPPVIYDKLLAEVIGRVTHDGIQNVVQGIANMLLEALRRYLGVGVTYIRRV
jgi:hypothetical protein